MEVKKVKARTKSGNKVSNNRPIASSSKGIPNLIRDLLALLLFNCFDFYASPASYELGLHDRGWLKDVAKITSQEKLTKIIIDHLFASVQQLQLKICFCP